MLEFTGGGGRQSGPCPAIVTGMDVEIRPLTGETWPALAGLFEEGGDPKWCWCQFWRDGASFTGDREAQRNQARSALREEADRSIAPGLVALAEDGRAVGWISLGPRSDFAHLERSRSRPRIDDLPVWAIVCFAVSRRARHQGLGGQLLEAGIAYARENGAPALEAYPVDTSLGKPTAPTLYTGTLSTFLRVGFQVVREVQSPQATVVRSIVRLDLG
jgi:GNAT superfamily N-acetyltransferase